MLNQSRSPALSRGYVLKFTERILFGFNCRRILLFKTNTKDSVSKQRKRLESLEAGVVISKSIPCVNVARDKT